MPVRRPPLPTSSRARDYRALFESSPLPVALLSTRGALKFTAVSRGFLAAVRLTAEELVGRGLGEVVTADARSKVAAAIQRCQVTAQPVRAQAELAHGGRVVHITVHRANARGFTGHVLLEVTGARQALPSGTERTALPGRSGDEQGRSFTYVHDLRSGRIRFVDEGLSTDLDLPRNGLTNIAALIARIHPDDLTNLPAYESLRDKLGDDDFVGATFRAHDREGDWRLINIRARILRRDRRGIARSMLGTVTDITEYAAAAVQAAGISAAGAEEHERARIGRELHDSTSQFLVAADLGVLRLLNQSDLSEEVRESLKSIQASLAAAQAETRAFALFLHPPELSELGLRKTLERFCAGFARRSGIAISVACSGGSVELEPETEHALFRVSQEALMNVHRHAFARNVTVVLDVGSDQVKLEVRDDGIGVDQAARFDQGGIGVSGMRARMRSIGGVLDLDVSGPGLTVTACAPHRLAKTSLRRGLTIQRGAVQPEPRTAAHPEGAPPISLPSL